MFWDVSQVRSYTVLAGALLEFNVLESTNTAPIKIVLALSVSWLPLNDGNIRILQ